MGTACPEVTNITPPVCGLSSFHRQRCLVDRISIQEPVMRALLIVLR